MTAAAAGEQQQIDRVMAAAQLVERSAAEWTAARTVADEAKAKATEVALQSARLIARLAEMGERLMRLEQESIRMTAEHKAIHEDITESKSLAATGAGRDVPKSGAFDMKHMKPEKFDPRPGDVQSYRDWVPKVEAFLARTVAPKMREILHTAMYLTEEISAAKSDEMGMLEQWDQDLRDFLFMGTGGEPFRVVKNGSHLPAIELWRQIAEGADPKSEQGNFKDFGAIFTFGRCNDYSKLRSHIADWEEQVQEYQNRSSEKLPKNTWKAGLMGLLPQELSDDLETHIDKYPTYASLKKRVFQVIVNKSRSGPARKSLSAVDVQGHEDYDQIPMTDDNGHCIMALVPRGSSNLNLRSSHASRPAAGAPRVPATGDRARGRRDSFFW